MVAVGFCLLLLLSLWPKGKPQGWQWMGRLGRVSYAFYLWHGPVILYSERLQLSRVAMVPATFAISLLAAILTTVFIERPMLRLRDRLFPANVAPAAAQFGPRPSQVVEHHEASLARESI
jgi:peptidoglycan/LPS O-acetylase OafA/YrhL